MSQNDLPHDPLFDLVQTLSTQERRYFTMSTKAMGKNQEYMQLYSILTSIQQYDEDTVKKRLAKRLKKKSIATKAISNHKKNLTEAIIKSLKSYNARRNENTPSHALSLIQDVKLLYSRGLYELSNKKLKEVKELARECGHTLIQLQINHIERDHLRFSREKNIEAGLKTLHEEEEQLLDHLKIESTYIQLYGLLLLRRINKSHLSNEKEIKELEQEFSKYFLPEELPSTVIGDRYFYLSASNYFFLINQEKKAKHFFNEIYLWWEKNEKWKNEFAHYYISAISNLLVIFLQHKQYDSIPSLLEKLENIEPGNIHEETMKFRRLMFNKHHFLMNTSLVEALELTEEIDKGLTKYQISEGFQIIFHSNIAIVFFLKKKFDDCIQRIKLLLRYRKMGQAQPIIQFSYILHVLCCFELEEIDSMENAYRSARHYFGLMEDPEKVVFEKNVLEKIWKMGKVPQANLKKHYNKLKDFLAKNKDTRVTGIEEMSIWVEYKLTGNEMEKILEEKLKRKS